ncbi:MAG TPA: hypothetical protein PK600_02770 [Deltaproteobacteria bacterium]|nr:hypothetical protein [Deltaproteobacteria bacterium]
MVEDERDEVTAMIFDREQQGRIEAQHGESPEVARLIAQRTQLLKEHPQLRALQDEIDGLLGTTIDPMVRLEILFMLMTDRLMEMRKVFGELMKLASYAGVDE